MRFLEITHEIGSLASARGEAKQHAGKSRSVHRDRSLAASPSIA
jgi:hypothetical protein